MELHLVILWCAFCMLWLLLCLILLFSLNRKERRQTILRWFPGGRQQLSFVLSGIAAIVVGTLWGTIVIPSVLISLSVGNALIFGGSVGFVLCGGGLILNQITWPVRRPQ